MLIKLSKRDNQLKYYRGKRNQGQAFLWGGLALSFVGLLTLCGKAW